MATAGYNPRAALDLWELMRCVEQDAEMSGQSTSIENKFAILRTHPTSEDRHKALEKDLDKAMRLWRQHMPKLPPAKSKAVDVAAGDGQADVEKGSQEPLKAEAPAQSSS